MPLTNAENNAITKAVKEKKQKQILGLLRAIHKTEGTGKAAAKMSPMHRQHLRELEHDDDPLIYYAVGYWFLTDLGKDTLALNGG